MTETLLPYISRRKTCSTSSMPLCSSSVLQHSSVGRMLVGCSVAIGLLVYVPALTSGSASRGQAVSSGKCISARFGRAILVGSQGVALRRQASKAPRRATGSFCRAGRRADRRRNGFVVLRRDGVEVLPRVVARLCDLAASGMAQASDPGALKPDCDSKLPARMTQEPVCRRRTAIFHPFFNVQISERSAWVPAPTLPGAKVVSS